MPELGLVIPVYNEQSAIEGVVNDWLGALRKAELDFRIIVLNDGSTDDTLKILKRIAAANSELQIVDKPNSGHGPSCHVGYRTALNEGCQWIMQVDSDGQCDPKYFPEFWQARNQKAAVMGFRIIRLDGIDRWLISRALSIVVLCTSFAFIRDLNVPYRLMHRDTLAIAVELIPPNFYLSNVLLSYIYQRRFAIKWISINFRERTAGKSKFNASRMATLGLEFMREFIEVKGRI